MITPNKFFRTDYGEGIRGLLSNQGAVIRIVDFGAGQVFTATTYTCLLFLQSNARDSFQYTLADTTPSLLAPPLLRIETHLRSVHHLGPSKPLKPLRCLAN